MRIIRNLFLVFIIGFVVPLRGQQLSYKDTVFIERDSLLGSSQSIFYDNNKDSKFYDQINCWRFQEFDNEVYDGSIECLKNNNQLLINREPIIPFTKWIPLMQYQGRFYVYHPCDFYNHFKVSINDTTYIDWTGEGPVANRIIEQKKINDKTFEFKLIGCRDEERKLVIHIIDRDKCIAVFEEINNGEKNRYLMISADKIKTVPLIVNNCEMEKQVELEFEEPNFIDLLRDK